MPLDVDPKGYYQAATNCFDAAEALRDSFLYVFRELSNCGAMAGLDEDGKAWATSYDTSAYQMVSFFSEVHSTLNAYGSALNDLGFNHAQADSTLQGTPQPQRPADRGTPVFGPFSIPASAGGSGKGVIDESIGLLSEIGVPVPDGDTDKLVKAADAWDRLGTIYQNTNAKDKITIAAGLFDNMTAPDAIQAAQDLKSLESSIAQLLNSCKAIAKSCTDYSNALKELRDEIKGFLSDLAKDLAIDAAITIVATAVSFGAGAITAVKSLATLKKWAGKIKEAIKLWKARKVAQLKGIADDAKVALSKSRQNVKDLFERLKRFIARSKKPYEMGSRPKEVPEGWVQTQANSGKGVVWQKPGSTGDADTIRIMEPTGRYPNGYVRFTNSHGQPLNMEGKPGSKAETHFELNEDGSFSKPKGW